MADGRWVMTEEELNRTACGFDNTPAVDPRTLPNFRQHKYMDNRNGGPETKCAFCGSEDVSSGFGGYGEGYGYRSIRCKDCGGTTDFVYRDDIGKFFQK